MKILCSLEMSISTYNSTQRDNQHRHFHQRENLKIHLKISFPSRQWWKIISVLTSFCLRGGPCACLLHVPGVYNVGSNWAQTMEELRGLQWAMNSRHIYDMSYGLWTGGDRQRKRIVSHFISWRRMSWRRRDIGRSRSNPSFRVYVLRIIHRLITNSVPECLILRIFDDVVSTAHVAYY